MDKLTETLLYIGAIIAFSIFSGWMKKRAQNQEEHGEPAESPLEPKDAAAPPLPSEPRTPQPSPRPSRPMNWEEELRRLLQGEEEETTPPPQPRPPAPPVVTRLPVPAPPPPSPARTLFPPAPLPTTVPIPATVVEPPLARLVLSAEAYQRAGQLRATASERLVKVGELERSKAAPVVVCPSSVDVQAARNLLRQPRTLRQAIMASVILRPPKALDMYR